MGLDWEERGGDSEKTLERNGGRVKNRKGKKLREKKKLVGGYRSEISMRLGWGEREDGGFRKAIKDTELCGREEK